MANTRTAGYVWFFHNHKWKQRYDPSAKLKVKVSSPKHHAPIFRKQQASSAKLLEQQATSLKPQAASSKLQATSFKLQDS